MAECKFDKKTETEELNKELQHLKEINDQLSQELHEVYFKLDLANQEIKAIKQSAGWRMLSPIRFCKKIIVDLMEKTIITHKIHIQQKTKHLRTPQSRLLSGQPGNWR